jgi:hypothetical protein
MYICICICIYIYEYIYMYVHLHVYRNHIRAHVTPRGGRDTRDEKTLFLRVFCNPFQRFVLACMSECVCVCVCVCTAAPSSSSTTMLQKRRSEVDYFPVFIPPLSPTNPPPSPPISPAVCPPTFVTSRITVWSFSAGLCVHGGGVGGRERDCDTTRYKSR